MKPRILNSFGPFVSMAFCLAGLCQTATAAAYTWDLSTDPAIQTGDGTWNTTDTNWSTTGISDSVWLQTSATVALHTATFAGADGTYAITLGGNVAAQKLTFSNSGYTLSAASAQTVALTDTGTGVITVASGKSATIGSNARVNFNSTSNTGQRVSLTGSSILNIAAGGTLTKSGIVAGFAATGSTLGFTGGVGTVNVEGTLSYNLTTPGNYGGIVISNGAVVNDNITLNVNNGGTLSSNSLINGVTVVSGNSGTRTGTLTVNTGGTVSTTSTSSATSGINLANGASSTGTVNLDGGTISTFQINSNYLNTSTNLLSTGGTSTFNFHGGTLKAIANNTAFMGGLTNAFVKSNGAVIDTNGFNVTVAQNLLTDPGSPGGGLTKQSGGTLTLTGASTYTGATQVSGGTLALTGSLTSNLIIDIGASITGIGSTTGTLTTNTGSTLIAKSAGGMLTASGGVNFAGSTSLVFDGVPLPSIPYDVVNYGAGGVSNLANLTSTTFRGTVDNDVPNTKVTFTAGAGFTRTWNVTDGTWVAGGSDLNWLEGDNKFLNGDAAVFGNPASPSTVTLSGTLFPQSVSVNNTNNYVFSGSGSIGGTSSLTKQGSGSLTLATVNSYTGNTTVNGGTVVLDANNAIPGGIGKGDTTLTSGTLDLNGKNLTLNNLSGAGTIDNTFTIDSLLTLNQTVDTTFSGLITDTGNPLAILKNGTSTLTLSNTNTYSGATTIGVNFDGTRVGVIRAAATQALGTGTVSVGFGGNNATARLELEGGISLPNNLDLAVRNSGTPSIQNISGINTLSGNVFIPVGGSGLTIQSDAGTLNLTGTTFGVETSAGSRTLNFTGAGDGSVSWPISNGAALSVAVTKDGAGTWTLSGLNTYTGNTTVIDGTLVITNDDVLADSSTVTIPASGSLNLTHSGTDIVGTLIINGVTQVDGLYTFGTGKIQVGTSTPFQTWAISKGLDGTAGKENGLADDPDNDGATNLREFAFNGNPLSGSDNGQIYVLTADSDVDSPDTNKELILTLAVRKTTPTFTAGAPATAPLTDGVNYSVHGSTDLASFGVTVTPVGFVDPGVALTDAVNYEYRSFSLNGSNGLAGKGFLRAKAEAP